MLFSHTSTVGLLFCLLASTSVTSRQSEDDSRVDTRLRRSQHNCINRILSNSMVSAIQLTVNVCYNVSFPKLCNHDETDATISNQWIISIQSDCTIAYTAINDSSQQHQQISNCDVIHQCWIVHNNKSICLYLDNSSDTVDHNRLHLASMKVEGGVWRFIDDKINIFTLFSRVDKQLPFFTGLYEAISYDEETATFVIGNSAGLSRVIVQLNGNAPSHRQRQVCARKITDVTVTDHLIVTCDNQRTYVQLLESWHDFNISSSNKLLRVLMSGSSKSYISDSGDVGMIVVTNETSNSTHVSYWLAYREHPDLEKCVDISATFTDGLLVEVDNSSVLFFAILNGNLTVVNESCNGPHTIATNVCHSGDCYLHHTKHLLYISDHQNRTIVINPRTYEIITYKHDDIRNVLPVTERAQQQCEDELRVQSTVVSTTITMTTTPATTINNNTASNTDTVTVFIAPTSNTFLSPTSTFETASTNPVPTQSTNNSMTTKAEMYKPYIIAGVVVTIGMVLTVVLAGCCLKRRCLQTQHKKLQINSQLEKKAEPPLPVFNLTSSPKQVLRHLSQHDTVQDCSEQSQRQPLSSHA